MTKIKRNDQRPAFLRFMENQNRLLGTKLVLGAAIAANGYFYLLFCIYLLQWRAVIVGVLTEMLTIPALLVLSVSGVLLAIRCFQGGLTFRQLLISSLLLASTVFIGIMAFLL